MKFVTTHGYMNVKNTTFILTDAWVYGTWLKTSRSQLNYRVFRSARIVAKNTY